MYFEPTDIIVSGCPYYDSSSSFFGNFPAAFDMARCQIAKVETRQEYQEPDNPSFIAMIENDWKLSLSLLLKSREVDVPLYQSLARKGVDFLRARPLIFPLSNYMKWEFEVYKFNEQMGERIFCCNYSAIEEFFKKSCRNDFMIFDARLALVHDYDQNGLIRGGWKVENISKIIELQKIFMFFKSNCQMLKCFML